MTPRWRRLLGAARVGVGLGLLYVVLSAAGGRAGVARLLANPWVVAGFFAQAFIGAAIEAKRLGLLLRSQRLYLPFGNGYRLVAMGTFFNFAIPGGTGGDVMKLVYLASENRSRGVEVAAVLLVDRVVGLFSLLAVAVGLAWLSGLGGGPGLPVPGLMGASLGVMALVVVGVGLAWSTRLRATAAYRYLTTGAPLHRQWERVATALHAFRDHRRALLAAIALSATGQLVLAGMFLATGKLLVPSASGLLTATLSLLGLVANALPVTPGGLGVGEAAFQALFAIAGHAGGAQLVLAWRAGLLPLAVAGGLLYVTGLRRRGARLTASDGFPSVQGSVAPDTPARHP